MKNKTKQDIEILREDVDHIKQSFYADLEAYYGNTKLIDDFQDISKWVGKAGIQSLDITNSKIGNQTLKITEDGNVGRSLWSEINNIQPIDLNKFNNGELSDDNDFINIVVYISDVTKIQNMYIGLDNSPIYNELNCKRLFIGVDNLVNGWNFIKFKKSNATTRGTGNWSSINSIRVLWTTVANAQNAYVSFQLIQLVKKDPLEDKPNPFQRFGVRELNILDKEWVITREFEELKIKCLGVIGITNCLVSKKTFKDFTMNVIKSSFSLSVESHINWYVDENNYLQFYINSSSQMVIRRMLNGVLDTLATRVVPLKSGELDRVIWVIDKKGDSIDVKVKLEHKNEIFILSASNIGISSSGVMTFGYSGADKGDCIYSASITEISHAHHSDVSEVAKESIFVPDFGIGTQKVSSEVNLNKYFYGGKFVTPNTGLINLPVGWTQLRHTIDVTGGGNYVTQILSADINNDTPKVAIRFGNNAGNTAVWSKWTEIAWKETPTETVITSGFASGWSGMVKYRKNQEGLVTIYAYLTKSTDIATSSGEALFTFPTGFRPSHTVATPAHLVNSSASLMKELVSFTVNAVGVMGITSPSGQTYIGARTVFCSTLSYYAV